MNIYGRDVLEPPERIVNDGQCNMGTFNKPFKVVNLLDARRPLGLPLPLWFNNLRLKEWEAIQLSSEEWFICIAVANLKLFGTAFIMLYNKKTGELYDYRVQSFSRRFKAPEGLYKSSCSFVRNDFAIEIENCLEQGLFEITFSAKGQSGRPDCSGSFTARHAAEPVVIVQPFGDNRPIYSHKELLPLTGKLSVGSDVWAFREGDGSAIIDDHKAFYPYLLHYDWATTMDWQKGYQVGFNLTDNQVLEPEKYNENCLWLGGRMIPLPPVKFHRPEGLSRTWFIQDEYGQIDLRFTPLAGEPLEIKSPLFSIFYYGPFGIFEGGIQTGSEEKISFDGCFGMGEKRDDRI